MTARTILVSIDRAPARRFHLTDRYLRTRWSDYPEGALTLAIDYLGGVVLSLRSPRPGCVATATTLAPLCMSGDPEPGCLTREDVVGLFRDD